MNRFIMTGRLVADPEVRYTQGGKGIFKFRFAVNRRTNGDHPEADYFNCVSFGKLAETMGRLQIVKGTKILIVGDVQNNNYTDKGGTKHYEQQFVLNTFEFLEKKGEKPATAVASAGASENWKETDEKAPFFDEGVQAGIDDDGLPF